MMQQNAKMHKIFSSNQAQRTINEQYNFRTF